MFHLPDLPNAGYATDREKRLSDAIMQFMREVERDRMRLLTIVIEGIETWRRVAGDIWGGYHVAVEELDAVFHYFELQALRPNTQRLVLKFHNNPQKWRAIMRFVMPHLENEREALRVAQKWSPYATH